MASGKEEIDSILSWKHCKDVETTKRRKLKEYI